ncbi:brachyurin-like isoform X2 [Neocloeon triangulifer]|uniref:brachyurin-like isoform X2 n=1 Tax=Neocloeon triangulifer TaxID=2078957 RepID=UPI00286F43A0|nr:brachyurin-like isoform X2 [Neocloeon triangulifer]
MVFNKIFLGGLLLTLLCIVEGRAKEDKFLKQTLSKVRGGLPEKEIELFKKDPKNKPTLDFTPTGKKAQPESAGRSKFNSKPPSSFIIGGVRASLKQFPWNVYLRIDNTWLCGGSLIADNAVLTAAHCVDDYSTFEVSAGGIDRSLPETNEQFRNTTDVVVHPEYNKTNLINNIAILLLETPFVLNAYVNVARLPRQVDASSTFSGISTLISGYGTTTNYGETSRFLNFVRLTTITNSKCASYYGSPPIVSSTICTAPGAKATCRGDGGNALVYKEADGLYTVIGVSSFTSNPCTSLPSGYTRVASFLGFISDNTDIAIRA